MNTATPFAKDVVIVIDVSGSMVLNDGDTWASRLDIAKGAAIAVLDSLSPQDRVSIKINYSLHVFKMTPWIHVV